MAARKKSRAGGSRAAKRRATGAKRRASTAAAKRGRSSARPKRKTAAKAARKTAKKAVRKAAKKPVRRRSASPRPAPVRRRATRAPAAPAAAPNAIGLSVQHMDYTTHAMDEVRRFYTEQLGFSDFTFDSTMSYLAVRTGPSSSLGFMPPMPVPPEQWQPPREPTIYLIVEDVDRAHRELVAKGVAIEQAPETMPWGHRTAVIRDPEGRRVCLAQILDGA